MLSALIRIYYNLLFSKIAFQYCINPPLQPSIFSNYQPRHQASSSDIAALGDGSFPDAETTQFKNLRREPPHPSQHPIFPALGDGSLPDDETTQFQNLRLEPPHSSQHPNFPALGDGKIPDDEI